MISRGNNFRESLKNERVWVRVIGMKIDWSKELWLSLLFVCVGFTIWPLMCYYGGRTLAIEYFQGMHLRDWAENRVYGPLVDGGLRSLSRLLFLLGPYFAMLGLRILLYKFSEK
tara:strand:- start:11401 stop:11742 length:342 start_codon:yes stop_codon:yes gene_type:complete